MERTRREKVKAERERFCPPGLDRESRGFSCSKAGIGAVECGSCGEEGQAAELGLARCGRRCPAEPPSQLISRCSTAKAAILPLPIRCRRRRPCSASGPNLPKRSDCLAGGGRERVLAGCWPDRTQTSKQES